MTRDAAITALDAKLLKALAWIGGVSLSRSSRDVQAERKEVLADLRFVRQELADTLSVLGGREPTYGLERAARHVVETFKTDEERGYHTKDREFAITLLETGLAAPRAEWTCFHCGETFTTPGSASDHLGRLLRLRQGVLIDRVVLEEGGKPERGRGLLMALRKAEAALGGRPETGWQPIATAPQDGSWMLAWHYDVGIHIWRTGPGLIQGKDFPEPTHWQPLPSPPLQEQP